MKIYIISFIGFCFLISMCGQTKLKIKPPALTGSYGTTIYYDTVYSAGEFTIGIRNDSIFLKGDSLGTIKYFFHECIRLQSEISKCILSKDSLKNGFYNASYYKNDLYW